MGGALRTPHVTSSAHGGDDHGHGPERVGQDLEAGVGIGFYQRSVPSIYEFVTRPDDTEIEQDLKLRVVPITGVVRFLAGRPGAPVRYLAHYHMNVSTEATRRRSRASARRRRAGA